MEVEIEISQAGRTLNQFNINGIVDTGKEIGRGSYAVVVELDFHGLKCAGKRLHQKIYKSASPTQQQKLLERFKDECELLESTKHTNIVQFLGLMYHQPDCPFPTLVMEYLPTTLDSFVSNNKNLPQEVSYSILEDVAVALRYLHESDPQIIHRDLSANNILLTRDLTAKISDLGVAKMLNLTPAQQTHERMSTCPGTPAYMPPEALEHEPVYDTAIDRFSYGVMMLHVFSGECPIPNAPNYYDRDTRSTVARTEVDRRQKYFNKLNPDHPLLDIIKKCLSMDPILRPQATEILDTVHQIASSFTNQCYTKAHLMQRVSNLEKQVARSNEEKEQIQNELQTQVREERERSELQLKKMKEDSCLALEEERAMHKSMFDCNCILETQIRDLETERDNLKGKLDTQTRRVIARESQLAELKKSLFSKGEQISTLQSEIQDEKITVNMSERDLRAKEQALSGMKQEIAGKSIEVQCKTVELKAKDEQLTGLQQQLESAKVQLALSGEKLKFKDHQIEKAQNIVRDMEKVSVQY